MNGESAKERILRLPLSIQCNGEEYIGEVVGKLGADMKYFTCRFQNANMLVIEAREHPGARLWEWTCIAGHQFSHLAPAIGREIEKSIMSGPRRHDFRK